MEEMLPLFEIRVGSKDSKALGIYRPSVDTSLVVLSNQPPKKKLLLGSVGLTWCSIQVRIFLSHIHYGLYRVAKRKKKGVISGPETYRCSYSS